MIHRGALERVCLFGLVLLALVSCRRAEEPVAPAVSLPVVDTKIGAEMVLIPAGTFVMGSTNGEEDEAPPHEVRVDSFLIDRTEITQEQYGRLVLGNPARYKGADRPVEQISWAEAALFCNLRSRDEGLQPCYDEETAKCDLKADGYRLPTEAEWEYACRAGSATDYAFGSDPRHLKQYAWYAENAGKKTQPVARKRANDWGLFDMHGNVAEWCNDVYDPAYYGNSPSDNPAGPAEGEQYVLRGGAWSSSAERCRSAARVGQDPGFQDACFARDAIGFRCVRNAPAASTVPRSTAGAAAGGPILLRLAALATGAVPAKSRTGLFYSDLCLAHDTGPGHPEQPARLAAIMTRLEKDGLASRFKRLKPKAVEDRWLTAVHSPEYIARVERRCAEDAEYVDSRDTPVSPRSHEAAVAAVGGVLSAIDAVMKGEVENAFCAVRPPGHHAMRDRAMGFCLLNNVAIAARYAQQEHRLSRILIVDWDVHHGNGTQAVFDDDPSVFYFSVHQSPFYPGTGAAEDRGRGRAAGTKLNVPLPAGSGDGEYRRAFQKLDAAARQFQPELVLISAGFDAHTDDPLGGMKVTAQGYGELTRSVREIARQHCQGRLVAVLEGGYNLEALAESVAAHLQVLSE